MKTMTIPELHEAAKSFSKTDLILDVRTPQEFAAGHIPGAKLIPYDQVMNHVNELKQYSAIYVYCRMGGRAYAACEILEALQLSNLVCIDEGGYPDWAAAGYRSAT